jgi:hypothetical protein
MSIHYRGHRFSEESEREFPGVCRVRWYECLDSPLRNRHRDVRRRLAFVTGCIQRRYKIAVSCPRSYLAVNVGGRIYGGDRQIGSVGLSAIYPVATNRRSGPGRRRVPLQQNGVGFVVGPHPEKHCAGNPKRKDRKNRQRQPQCSFQWKLSYC